ncbi:MAG: hypothetical protein ACK6C4_03530, partial [Bacteroidota bacterium]
MRTLRACFVMAFAIVLAPSLTFAQTRVLTRADSLAREAMLYMDGNLPQSAITAWDMALKEVPGYVPFLYEKAVALVMAERHREAIELIE